MAKLTIDAVKKLKVDLESTITKLMIDFEAKTQMNLRYVNIQRKVSDGGSETDMPMHYEERQGDIKDVTIEANIDF